MIILSGCICATVTDDAGYGNCDRKWEDEIGCYLPENIPNTCSDTVAKAYPPFDEGRPYSKSEACKRKYGIDYKSNYKGVPGVIP